MVSKFLLELDNNFRGLVDVAFFYALELFEHACLAVVEHVGEFLESFLVCVDFFGAEVATWCEVTEWDAEFHVGTAKEW